MLLAIPRTHFGSVNGGLLLANDFHILIPENSDAITAVAAAAVTRTAPANGDVRFARFLQSRTCLSVKGAKVVLLKFFYSHAI